jgi:hypothetical protein
MTGGIFLTITARSQWYLSVMRTPECAPAFLSGKEQRMLKRRRFKQTKSLKERLLERAEQLREEAKLLPYGLVRDAIIKRARQAEAAAHMDEWLNSPGLQPPKKHDTPGPH